MTHRKRDMGTRRYRENNWQKERQGQREKRECLTVREAGTERDRENDCQKEKNFLLIQVFVICYFSKTIGWFL